MADTKCEKLQKKIHSECFIQNLIKHEIEMGHTGMTHKLLGVPLDFNLSHAETLLQKIVDTPIGNDMKNPLKIGKPFYKVTKKLKQHVNSSLNLIRISEGKYKK